MKEVPRFRVQNLVAAPVLLFSLVGCQLERPVTSFSNRKAVSGECHGRRI